MSDDKPRPRAADDFDVIRARVEELRKEREEVEKAKAPPRDESVLGLVNRAIVCSGCIEGICSGVCRGW